MSDITGVTWEDLHGELRLLMTKEDGGRLENRIEALSLAVAENTLQMGVMLSDNQIFKAFMVDHSGKLDGLRTDLTTLQVESARGDKRVGMIAATLAFIGSAIAAALGRN